MLEIKCSEYRVSAGLGEQLNDYDSWKTIEIPDTPNARKADFALIDKFPNDRACAEWFKKFYSDIPNDYSETTVSQTNSTNLSCSFSDITNFDITMFIWLLVIIGFKSPQTKSLWG